MKQYHGLLQIKKIEDILKSCENPIKISNPISSELSFLRSTLVGNLLITIQKNINRNITSASFFEVGPVFYEDKSYKQEEYVCGIRTGFFFMKKIG